MNGKATKQQIQWPPLLNMCDDRPHVDETFRNVEKLNAPFVNEMLQPVWIKNLGQEYIHDVEGNKYDVEEGVFKRNGTPLFTVENKHFEKTDVTERFVQYHDYDLSDNTEAWTIWDEDNNRFNIHYNGLDLSSSVLFQDGFVVTSRIRILNNCAVFVIFYNTNFTDYVQVIKIDEDGTLHTFTNTAEWYLQTPRRVATAAQSWTKLSNVINAKPVICIADLGLNIIGVSLTTDSGKCLNTKRNGFITYLIYDNTLKQLGKTILPSSQTTPVTVENVTPLEWVYYNTISTNTAVANCISADNVTFYKYEQIGVVGEEITIPSDQLPTATGSVTISGVSYTIYQYTVFKTLLTSQCLADRLATGFTWKFAVQKANQSETWVESTNDDVYNPKSLSVSYTTPYSDVTPSPDVINVIKKVKVTWKWDASDTPHEVEYAFDSNDMLIGRISDSHTETASVSAGWLVSPNVVLDNGRLYAMYSVLGGYSTANNWNNQTLTNGSIFQESGTINAIDWANNQYSIATTEFVTLTTNYNVLRSNSFGIAQNFVTTTEKLNNSAATSSYTMYNNGSTTPGTESVNAVYLEINNSNATDKRYYPGTFVDSSYNYYGDSLGTLNSQTKGPAEDYMIFTPNGYRVPVKDNSKFKLLYYVNTGNTVDLEGISYAENDSDEGTLLTPWDEIDAQFYVVCNSDKLIYKDYNNRYWEISVKEGTRLFSVLEDRYLVVNTTSYLNCYDSQLNQIKHYASDYNNRLMFGTTTIPVLTAPAGQTVPLLIKKDAYIRTTAAAENPIYTRMPRSGITSNIYPPITRARVMVEDEKAYGCDNGEIDVFYSELDTSSVIYKYTLKFKGNSAASLTKANYVDSVYGVTSFIYGPNLFTEFINGAGNNDLVKENFAAYVLNYDNQQPFLNYNLNSQTTGYGRGQIAFFVLQGQFYLFANEKIYSVIYNSGVISTMDAIVDAKGMQFVGFNPQIAFFYSPAKRMFYSFTGDAILQSIYDASKIKSVTGKYFYDENTQSIYVPNDAGLLVFGPKNSYMFENWKNTTNIQFSSDGITHITDNNITYDLSYYQADGFEVLPIKLETSFYGLGGNEDTSIDRWDIVLYDNTHGKDTSYIKVKERSLTNVTQVSDEKTYTITPEMYDKWSSSYLVPHVPQLQKGLGIRLEIETPLTIARIVPHIMDMETGMTNKMNNSTNTIKKYSGGIN